jgi:hypothetical protein
VERFFFFSFRTLPLFFLYEIPSVRFICFHLQSNDSTAIVSVKNPNLCTNPSFPGEAEKSPW